jgi:pimeloyl-ACP methyl ester carboxylesterase
MGGKVIQRVAVNASDRVKSMHAVTPVPASRLEFDAMTEGLFKGAVTDDEKRSTIVNFSSGSRLTPLWIKKIVGPLAQFCTQEAFGGYLASWTGDDFAAQAKGIKVPIKVSVGKLDPSITRGLVETTFKPLYPNIEFEILDNVGHYPMEELPIYMATSINEFIARHP